MNISRIMLKNDAKAAIRESSTSPYLTAAVYVLIAYVLNYLNTRITGVLVDYDLFYYALETGDYDYLYYLTQNQVPSGLESLIGTLISLMSLILAAGFRINTLLVSRRQPNTVGNLFDGFGFFLRIIWLNILIGWFTFLWSLLFVIPGIIAAYRYRQAIYILIDNPDMRAIDCIRRSKEMMKGHKAELFELDLSFLGWIFLTIIPLVSIYVFPYTHVTYAGYYSLLLGDGDFSEPPYNTPYRSNKKKDDELPPWEFKDR